MIRFFYFFCLVAVAITSPMTTSQCGGQGFWYPQVGATQMAPRFSNSVPAPPAYYYSVPPNHIGRPFPPTIQPQFGPPVFQSQIELNHYPPFAGQNSNPHAVISGGLIEHTGIYPGYSSVGSVTYPANSAHSSSSILYDSAPGMVHSDRVEVPQNVASDPTYRTEPVQIIGINEPSDLSADSFATNPTLPNESAASADNVSAATAPHVDANLLSADYSACLQRARKAEERVHALEKDLAASEAVRIEFETQMRVQSQTVSQVAEQLERAIVDKQELEQTINALTEKLAEARSATEKAERKVESSQEQLAKSTEELKKLTAVSPPASASPHKDLEAKLKKLERELGNTKRQLKTSLTEKAELEQRLKKSSGQPSTKPTNKNNPSDNKAKSSDSTAPQQPKRPTQPKSVEKSAEQEPQEGHKQVEKDSEKGKQSRPADQVEQAKPGKVAEPLARQAERIELLKEKIKVLEETERVTLEQAQTRIRNRIEAQKQKLLDSGLATTDQKTVDLDKRLQSELNNSATKIRAEFAGKISAIRAELKKLSKK